MVKREQVITWMLTPLSWIYGGIMALRNWLFDNKVLSQSEYDVSVVSVGNITVGGTGKTPHVEYILSCMASDYNIAVLSRGYKRKTRGFLMANSHSTPESIGDEPLQIYRKFGMRVKVAVCEKRKKGICELLRQYPDIQMILLDDAFQHRYVKPRVSILLTDHSHPIYKDRILPLGRLRESWRQVERADMVVVTKCPDSMQPIDYRLFSKDLEIRPYQGLYFSTISYGSIMPVYPDDEPYNVNLSALTHDDSVLLLTGIANPRNFVRYFRNYPFKATVCHYDDHHDFSRKDIADIEKKFNSLTGKRKMILTTEKDAVRLAYNPYVPHRLKQLMYYLPISVRMKQGLDSNDFISDIIKRTGL